MNFDLEFYDVAQINIKKGTSYSKSDEFSRWYNVSLNIKNKYFNYNETRESLLEYELWDIYHTLNKCLNNELDEDETLHFIEEDLELVISECHYMELKILVNLDGIISDDYYSITLYEEEMILLRDYIGKVLKVPKKIAIKAQKNKKKTTNNIDYDLFNKYVRVICNDGREIYGTFEDDFKDNKEILIGNILISYDEVEEMSEIESFDDKLYTYASIVYDDDIIAKTINEPYFYYKTDLPVRIGDKVLIDRGGYKTYGIVIDIEQYCKDDVPYPLEKTKDILKIIENQINEESNLKKE